MLSIFLFLQGIGFPEILIILFVILLLFGGRKIPQLAKDLGSGIREFRKSMASGLGDDSTEPTQSREKFVPQHSSYAHNSLPAPDYDDAVKPARKSKKTAKSRSPKKVASRSKGKRA